MNLNNVLSFWRSRNQPMPFGAIFRKFKGILQRNNHILELMSDMGDKLGGEYIFDKQYILSSCEELGDAVFKLISDFSVLTHSKSVDLFTAFERIQFALHEEIAGKHSFLQNNLTIPLENLSLESEHCAGNKMSTLGMARNVLGHQVPDGFVITTKAFFDFLDAGGLRFMASDLISNWDGKDEEGFEHICDSMRLAIMKTEPPKALAENIHAQAKALISRTKGMGGGDTPLLAVRSSAWGEGDLSTFAGQYESILGVSPENLMDTYKRVVAATYTPQAWNYRLLHGFREEELGLAVGVQIMVDAAVSGILHTYPSGPHVDAPSESMIVHCAPGLGAPLMDGTIDADTVVLDREPPYLCLNMHYGNRQCQLRLSPMGDAVWEEVPEERRNKPCLTRKQMSHLAWTCLSIEDYLKRPLEVEWSFDQDGKLNILQARPLNVEQPSDVPVFSQVEDAEEYPLQGVVVQHGVAFGKVHVVLNDQDLRDMPNNAILVARFTSPRFSRVMSKIKGIVTDVGSPAGHMATIAREHRIPTLVNTGNATSILKNGQEITLDASHNRIYRGIIRELRHFELTGQCVFEDSYEYRLLRRVLSMVAPLHLVDPKSEEFTPTHCRTYHDITRYIHEKAVEELIWVSEKENLNTKSHHLASEIPLGLTVLDIEDGLKPSAQNADNEIPVEGVASIPFANLLKGVLETGMWNITPVSLDFGSFMSSFTKTFTTSQAMPQRIGRNLAVISKNYVNLHLRLGYHFNIIDAYMAETLNDNYIYFRFLGGVTGIERRSRRVRFIADILERFDFRTEIRGDLVVGRIKKFPLDRGVERMVVLGGLVAYTRQLDVVLCTEGDLRQHVTTFMERINKFLEN